MIAFIIGAVLGLAFLVVTIRAVAELSGKKGPGKGKG